MVKENKKKVVLILIGLILLAGWFYWFQYRPTQIKHDCSWVREIEAAKPVYPTMTEEQLRQKGMLENCSLLMTPNVQVSDTFTNIDKLLREGRRDVCLKHNQTTISDYSQERSAVPEKEYWRKATDEEYKFCLRDKGL